MREDEETEATVLDQTTSQSSPAFYLTEQQIKFLKAYHQDTGTEDTMGSVLGTGFSIHLK